MIKILPDKTLNAVYLHWFHNDILTENNSPNGQSSQEFGNRWMSIERESTFTACVINPIQDRPFRGLHGCAGAKKAPLSKTCHTYPTILWNIPYLKKTQKLYKLRDTSLEFCWNQHFFSPEFNKFWHIKKYRDRVVFNI